MYSKRKVFLFGVLWMSLGLYTVQASFMILPYDADKRVLVPTENIGTDWRSDIDYADSTWQLCTGAPGGIGYEKETGYEDLITLDVGDQMYQGAQNPNTSCYIRIPFYLTQKQLDNLANIIINVRFDDDFVAYLNGYNIINVGGSRNPRWDSNTYLDIESTRIETGILRSINSLLVAGENLLAVQALNHSLDDPDFLFYCELVGEESPFSDTTKSILPLVFLDTNGESIPQNNRISAHLSIIDHGTGQDHALQDSINGYDGDISIEIRGSSSATWPKKQYNMETQDAAGNNNNVPLMGLPTENDWILNAPYIDKSAMRNVLIYYLSRQMGQYAPRTRFCEVFLNNYYQGVYILMEKIKRDNDRVDIARLDADDVAGDSLTGGYIIKIDKSGNRGFLSDYQSVTGNRNILYQFHYPKDDEIQPEQEAYIESYIKAFEDAMAGSNFADPDVGYAKYIDADTFVDFMLLNEIAKNVDGYRLSTFLYKDRDDNGGLLKAGPIWDFNLGFGLANYYDAEDTDGWMVNELTTGEQITLSYESSRPPFWFQKLLKDPVFLEKLRNRWKSLRQDLLATETVHQYIDAVADTLQEAQARNFVLWSPPGEGSQGFWPVPSVFYSFSTYQDEVDYLKQWIKDRFDWMDANIDVLSDVEDNVAALPDQFKLGRNYPNPFNANTVIPFELSTSGQVKIVIYDVQGRLVRQLVHEKRRAGSYQIVWDGCDDAGMAVASGVYTCQMQINGQTVKSGQKKMIMMK